MKATAPDSMTLQNRELIAAWCAVANSKLVEFRRQAWRLSMLVRQGVVDKRAAIDQLWEIAVAHALVRSLGPDRIAAVVSEAFCDADFRAMCAEVVA
jgi:hypothetical protein